ncbi:MAG TPA: VOC family protein [Catalimonadaceae bacterium]|nr:VOC family protein [Catalimonadaceae bacterium]
MFQFDHIAFYVSDLEKSIRFYRELFDLKPIPNPFPNGKAWFELGANLQLHLIENPKGVAFVPERNHISFSTITLEDFTSRLDQEGITWSDFKGNQRTIRLRPDGVQQVYFQDPDGYWIEVNDIVHIPF